MKGKRVLSGGLVWLAVLGFCLPHPILAAGAAAEPAPAVIDVALTGGGLLIGQVVDTQGAPLSKVPVSLRTRDGEVGNTRTDASGRFAFRGLRGGVYQAVAAGDQVTFRLWAPGTAPPPSQQGLLLIAGRQTVRGQCYEQGCGECVESCAPAGAPGCGKMACCLANPWIVAGIIATAVAVPVAIHNADGPSSP
jgi:hypothetical protein